MTSKTQTVMDIGNDAQSDLGQVSLIWCQHSGPNQGPTVPVLDQWTQIIFKDIVWLWQSFLSWEKPKSMQFWTIYALTGALFINILCPDQEPSNRWRQKHKLSWTLRMNTNIKFLQPACRDYWLLLRTYSTLMYTQLRYIRLELNVGYFAVRVVIYWVLVLIR